MSAPAETPFRSRFEALLKMLYSGDRRPNPSVTDASASWMVDDAEIWGTCGDFDRLTRLVLGAHRLRLAIALTARRGEPGFRVVVSPRWIAPDDSTRHHPGLGDLAHACYSMAGKASPVLHSCGLLQRAQPLIAEALMGHEPGDAACDDVLPAEIDAFITNHGRAA